VIYADYNATAPLWPEVSALLAREYGQFIGNPSSVHGSGRAARAKLTAAREKIAHLLRCSPRDVVFTSGGTEGAGLAIAGAFRAQSSRKKIVTTQIEHACVGGIVSQLGAEVVRVPPGSDVISALDANTALCSVMWVNNETGSIQPIAEIARACAERGIIFHTDAVQAIGKIESPFTGDLLSLSAHKFGGPVGAGVLIVRRGVNLQPLVSGHHEDGRRGGTQAVVLAEALALAMEKSIAALPTEGPRLTALRDRFETQVRKRIDNVFVNAADAPRAPGTSNLRFEGADGEALLIALDLEGIHVSSGAACASGSVKPSHVLTALGLTSSQAQASLRFSFGRDTSEAEIDAIVAALEKHVPKTRNSLSP
jgi:cysteine desulfurase